MNIERSKQLQSCGTEPKSIKTEGSAYLDGTPVVEVVVVHVLGRPLAPARRDEVPPCTWTPRESVNPKEKRKRKAAARTGAGQIRTYRRSRRISGTGAGPRRRPRGRSPATAAESVATPRRTAHWPSRPPLPAAQSKACGSRSFWARPSGTLTTSSPLFPRLDVFDGAGRRGKEEDGGWSRVVGE